MSHSHHQFPRFTQGTPRTITLLLAAKNGLQFKTRAFLQKARWPIYVFNSVVNTKLPAILSHRRSTTVSLETCPLSYGSPSNYNHACLSACRANMDIQYVLNVYAYVVYIVNYTSKGQKGMSELLRQAYAGVR